MPPQVPSRCLQSLSSRHASAACLPPDATPEPHRSTPPDKHWRSEIALLAPPPACLRVCLRISAPRVRPERGARAISATPEGGFLGGGATRRAKINSRSDRLKCIEISPSIPFRRALYFAKATLALSPAKLKVVRLPTRACRHGLGGCGGEMAPVIGVEEGALVLVKYRANGHWPAQVRDTHPDPRVHQKENALDNVPARGKRARTRIYRSSFVSPAAAASRSPPWLPISPN
jgi:hypothetical protein